MRNLLPLKDKVAIYVTRMRFFIHATYNIALEKSRAIHDGGLLRIFSTPIPRISEYCSGIGASFKASRCVRCARNKVFTQSGNFLFAVPSAVELKSR